MSTWLPAELQSHLRATGLLADVHERWSHPSGTFHLQPMPRNFDAERRQRSDRMTTFERMNQSTIKSRTDRKDRR